MLCGRSPSGPPTGAANSDHPHHDEDRDTESAGEPEDGEEAARDQAPGRRRRAWAEGPDLRAEYARHRPNVERTVAQVATRGGRRLKLRYRGTIKNNAWLKTRTAAVNLRNLIGRGLTHQQGTWTIAVLGGIQQPGIIHKQGHAHLAACPHDT